MAKKDIRVQFSYASHTSPSAPICQLILLVQNIEGLDIIQDDDVLHCHQSESTRDIRYSISSHRLQHLGPLQPLTPRCRIRRVLPVFVVRWGERILSTAVAAAILPASFERRAPAPRLPPIFTASTAVAAAAFTAATLPLAMLLFSLASFAAALTVPIGAGPTPAAPLLGHHHETILSVKAACCLGEAGVFLLQLLQPPYGHLLSTRPCLSPHLSTTKFRVGVRPEDKNQLLAQHPVAD